MAPADDPRAAAERIYHAWDDALRRKDLEASLALYAPDATLESPLVRHLRGGASGIVRGREQLRQFIALVFRSNPPSRRHHRSGFFTDGETLIWEYPRAAPDGEQIDLVEVIRLKDGLIQHHRVYWGWFGMKTQLSVGR